MGRASISVSFLAHSCDRYLRSPSSARWVRRQSPAASRELLKPWRQEFRTCDLRLQRLGLLGWVPISPVSLCISSSAAQFGTPHPGIGFLWDPPLTAPEGDPVPHHTHTHTHTHTHPIHWVHTHTHTHPIHWVLCLYPRLQRPPFSHFHPSPTSPLSASKSTLECLRTAFFISPKFSLLADEEELFIAGSKGVSYPVSGELGAAQTAQVCLAGDAWRGPGRLDLGEGGVSIRAGSPGPK